MDALDLLKQEHEKTKQKFTEIESADPEMRGELWENLIPLLRAHEEVEEQFVYGPVSKEAPRDTELASWMEEHETDVSEADDLIRTIDGIDPPTPEFVENLNELRTTLVDHMDREETEIWPEIRAVWDEKKLGDVGQQVEQGLRERVGTA
jgi:hemerythrin superfamily protein